MSVYTFIIIPIGNSADPTRFEADLALSDPEYIARRIQHYEDIMPVADEETCIALIEE
jgi:hypothetical protein